MDNAGYVTLSRQTGLLKELTAIANNIANISTAGFRREGVIFAEHVKSLGGGDPSLSIATANNRYIDFSEGDIAASDNPLDVAIEGDGFFLVESPAGPRLTRAGAFTLNAAGEITSMTGHRVLDEAGGALVVPPGTQSIAIAADGTIAADGQPVGRLGVVTADYNFLVREGDNMFRAEGGYRPSAEIRVRQNAIEAANVSAVTEIAHMIEVQRAYESGQQVVQSDDERIRRAVRELGQTR